MTDAQKTVNVEALELHTYDGKTYHPGDRYAIAEAYADSVVSQGKAKRTDPSAQPAAKVSSQVAPIGTGDFPSGHTKP